MSGRQMGGLPPQPHPVLSIDVISQNRRKIQVLREDQQEMLGTHAALSQDLSVAHQQLRQLAETARKVREGRDLEVKEVHERCLRVEAQVRGIEAIQAEHDQVVAHVREMNESKLQLAAEFNDVDSELGRIKVEAAEVAELKADVDIMRRELQKGRAAIDFEKKTRAANQEQYQVMERNLTSMKNEIEKLRDELAHAEKRARAVAAAASNPDAGYSGNYRGPDMVFQGVQSALYPTHREEKMKVTNAGEREGVNWLENGEEKRRRGKRGKKKKKEARGCHVISLTDCNTQSMLPQK